MSAMQFHFLIGWISILAGVSSGAVVGLFFHREDWLGGYGSLRRRLIRLGHVAFFGMGFLNVMFALSLPSIEHIADKLPLLSTCFAVGAICMPLCCYLCAWRKSLRHLFVVPVACLLIGSGLIACCMVIG